MSQKLEVCKDENGSQLRGFLRSAKTGIVYHIKMIKTNHLRFSTGIKTSSSILKESEFQKIQKAANNEITRRLNVEKRATTTLPLIREEIAKIITSYEKKVEAEGASKHTLNTVRSSFEKIEEFWGGMLVSEISASNWEMFQDWFEEHYPGYNAANVTKYMRVLRSHCIESGMLRLKPTIVDRNRKKSEKKRNAKKDWVYSKEDILKIQNACLDDKERLIIGFGHMMAFRISDALNLTWDRIDLEKGLIKFGLGDDKEDSEADCPIPNDLISILESYDKSSNLLFHQKHKLDQPLKPQQFDFKSILDRAGVTRGVYHSLRHYRLSEDFKNPKFTAAQVCAIRRISFVVALKHYIHMDGKDLELLRNAGSLSIKETSEQLAPTNQ